MRKSNRAIISALILTILPAASAFACRYNVRETGFIDLGMDPYVLCGFVDSNTPEAFSTAFKQVCKKELAQSNVIFRTVDLDKKPDHAAIKYFDPNTQSPPCAVLISPDSQQTPISLTKTGEAPEKTIRSAIKRILASPVRTKVMEGAAKQYGVILLIEGPKAEENAKAKKGALGAIEQVSSQMEYMPKEIANPPGLIVMDHASVKKEEIFLWSLDLEAKDVNEPLAIIVYGRGRWIGPLYRGEQVNEDDLASVLFVVGADCECGLDYRWLMGTMLPAKWDRKLHESAVKSLGFDPESPMIKMEMGSIIGRGLGRRGYPSTPLGYQELIIESEMDMEEPELEEIIEEEASESETEASDEIGDTVEIEDKTIEGAGETDAESEGVEGTDTVVAKETEEGIGDTVEIEDKTVEGAGETGVESEEMEDGGESEGVEEGGGDSATGDGTSEAVKAVKESVEVTGEAAKQGADSKEGSGSRVDPNLIRRMLREEAGGRASEDAKGDEDVFGAMRSTALLTIGLFAFVVICGVAVLARARRR